MPKLGCFAFGKKLLQIDDLDPVYVLLNGCSSLRDDQDSLRRWLLPYWSFYHMGTACWIAEGYPDQYWDRFEEAAASSKYPRKPERRHFRGQAACKSVAYLRKKGFQGLFAKLHGSLTCTDVMEEVQKWYMFGPWIAFKVADMLERLDLAEVSFKTEDVYLFESPLIGARQLRESLSAKVGEEALPAWAVETIIGELSDYTAPPRHERFINAQEAETILCKWKSYNNNQYKIGEDIESCLKSLAQFQSVPLAVELITAGQRCLLW